MRDCCKKHQRVPASRPTPDRPCEKCNYLYPPDSTTPGNPDTHLAHDLQVDLLCVPALQLVPQVSRVEVALNALSLPPVLLDLYHTRSLLLI
jgi:hypothetical protein